MVKTQVMVGPILSFRDFVRRKSEIFDMPRSVFSFEYFPIMLELKFLFLRYCDFIDRFTGYSAYVPKGGVPTSYRFGGLGIMELLRVLNTFDNGKALTTLNEIWQFTPYVRQYPTRQGHTYYPLSPDGFKGEFKTFASLKFSEMQMRCAESGGRVITVEEFMDYLIDCCLRFRISLKDLIRSMIPQISSHGVTDYIMIRCANSAHASRRLHIVLNQRGELFIMERPSESFAPDIGTLCSFRMP